MKKIKISIEHMECYRCGYQWIPKSKKMPRTCPKCRSAYWDKPRRKKFEIVKGISF
jgi:predicted Zn-ribbon and HTH transcriptional regulator